MFLNKIKAFMVIFAKLFWNDYVWNYMNNFFLRIAHEFSMKIKHIFC